MIQQMEMATTYKTSEQMFLNVVVDRKTDTTVEKVRDFKAVFAAKPQKRATQGLIFEQACRVIESIGVEQFFLLGSDSK